MTVSISRCFETRVFGILFVVEPGVKYYRDVLLKQQMLPVELRIACSIRQRARPPRWQ